MRYIKKFETISNEKPFGEWLSKTNKLPTVADLVEEHEKIVKSDNVDDLKIFMKKIEREEFKKNTTYINDLPSYPENTLYRAVNNNSINILRYLVDNVDTVVDGDIAAYKQLGQAYSKDSMKVVQYIKDNIEKFGGKLCIDHAKRWIKASVQLDDSKKSEILSDIDTIEL